ncbi:hypothetical protein YC2023_086666 [Brassica napus]
MSLSPSSREINLASSSILDQSVAALEFHHLISSFYSEISSHLISSHRSRSNLISSHRSRLGKNLISSQKRRRLEEKARIEGRMKLRQHARLAVMKVEEDEEEEEEEARSDCRYITWDLQMKTVTM